MPGIPATIHLALGITEMSLPRNQRSIIRMELFLVPLYKSYFYEGRSVQKAGRDHTGKHEAVRSTTATCAQVGEDVTAESQAVQPEREELPPLRTAGGREKQGKPNTTERLSNYAQCVVITSEIQAILLTCNSNTTLLQKILRRLLSLESSNARIQN